MADRNEISTFHEFKMGESADRNHDKPESATNLDYQKLPELDVHANAITTKNNHVVQLGKDSKGLISDLY